MKLEFDLELLELALTKTIEICHTEVELLAKRQRSDKLEKLFAEKEDLLEFFAWHKPLIISYLQLHKNQTGDFKALALRLNSLTEMVEKTIKTKIPLAQTVFGQELVSSITIFSKEETQNKVEVIFLKDSETRPTTIARLFKELIALLESNFYKIQSQMEMKEIEIKTHELFVKQITDKNNKFYNRPGQKNQTNLTYSNCPPSIIVKEKV